MSILIPYSASSSSSSSTHIILVLLLPVSLLDFKVNRLNRVSSLRGFVLVPARLRVSWQQLKVLFPAVRVGQADSPRPCWQPPALRLGLTDDRLGCQHALWALRWGWPCNYIPGAGTPDMLFIRRGPRTRPCHRRGQHGRRAEGLNAHSQRAELSALPSESPQIAPWGHAATPTDRCRRTRTASAKSNAVMSWEMRFCIME